MLLLIYFIKFFDHITLKNYKSLMASVKHIATTSNDTKNMIGFLDLNDIVNYYFAQVVIHSKDETADRWILTCK